MANNHKYYTVIASAATILLPSVRVPRRGLYSFLPKGSMQEYGIYLGPTVVIWEPLKALSIYYIATWSLWVSGLRAQVRQLGFCR